MLRFGASLGPGMFFSEYPFLERFDRVADGVFGAVEYPNRMARTFELSARHSIVLTSSGLNSTCLGVTFLASGAPLTILTAGRRFATMSRYD